MAGLLSAAELVGMRATADQALPDVAAIARLTGASDGRGGQGHTYAIAIGSVPARLARAGGAGGEAEEVAAGRLGVVAPWVVTFPHGTDIRETDRIGINGLLLEVTILDKLRSDSISVRAGCKEIT